MQITPTPIFWKTDKQKNILNKKIQSKNAPPHFFLVNRQNFKPIKPRKKIPEKNSLKLWKIWIVRAQFFFSLSIFQKNISAEKIRKKNSQMKGSQFPLKNTVSRNFFEREISFNWLLRILSKKKRQRGPWMLKSNYLSAWKLFSKNVFNKRWVKGFGNFKDRVKLGSRHNFKRDPEENVFLLFFLSKMLQGPSTSLKLHILPGPTPTSS